jgi:hypothetical protein
MDYGHTTALYSVNQREVPDVWTTEVDKIRIEIEYRLFSVPKTTELQAGKREPGIRDVNRRVNCDTGNVTIARSTRGGHEMHVVADLCEAIRQIRRILVHPKGRG